MTDAVVAPPAPPVSAMPVSMASPVAFTGVRSDFRRLVTRGALLELITLGFYRFWLATDMRRHLWSHTTVDGDAPEYTGTAKELLIGFLVALAILVPVYLAYFLIGLEAERLQAFASVPLVLFFYLFAQFAIYRARRYRLSRTIWRGVRFWMTGSGWAYAWRAGLWTLLVIVTLGLALPWSHAALERYKMRHSFFGDLPGRFDAPASALFKKIWWLWLVTVLMIALTGGLAVISPPAAGLLGTLITLWLPFGYAIYQAHVWRWWVSGIRFGDVRFESKLADIALVDLYWTVIGWSWLIMVVLVAWMFGVIGLVYLFLTLSGVGSDAFATVMQNPVLTGLIVFVTVLGYLACALAFGIVLRMYLRRDVWARVVASTVVYNLGAADNVVAKGAAASALGEGFADGLDIGGF
jgi:uncharacterized membrane protein YjgN (DUF898 family)